MTETRANVEAERPGDCAMDQPLFDASSEPEGVDGNVDAKSASSRPFLGIRFQCCRTYGRIYRNDENTAYVGSCPKCFGRVKVPIASGGTSSRFFNAG